MSEKQTRIVVAGIMLSLFLAAVESTVVATAMPTIVAELGGLASYSWVFSAYMLTSTTTVPLYGKLSDLYGRRRLYFISMTIFLVGSALSGLSQSMGQLIAFRALQGLGAGGIMPLSFIMIGDMLEPRAAGQNAGALLGRVGGGGDHGPAARRLPGRPAVVALGLLRQHHPRAARGVAGRRGWRDTHRHAEGSRPQIDYAGVALLSLGVLAFLLGLLELGTPFSWACVLVAALLFVALFFVERRAADPVLPLALFPDRLFAVATVQGLLAGWAMFGSTNFVPLFGQAVMGLSATAAGSMLAPQMLSWMFASVIGSRLLLRIGYRTVAVSGMVLLTAGALLMTRVAAMPSTLLVVSSLGLMGAGMGLALPAFLIAVQNEVRRDMLGAATATLQFSRNIGGTLGVSVMGAIFAANATANLMAQNIDPSSVSLAALIGGADLASLARGEPKSKPRSQARSPACSSRPWPRRSSHCWSRCSPRVSASANGRLRPRRVTSGQWPTSSRRSHRYGGAVAPAATSAACTSRPACRRRCNSRR